MATYTKMTDEKVQQLIDLYKSSNISLKAVAERIGISHEMVRKYLYKYNVPVRKRGFPGIITQELIDKVVSLFKQGIKAKEIAQQLNVPYSRVYQALRRAGCKFPPKGQQIEQEVLDKIHEYRKKGYSYYAIAKLVGRSHMCVSYNCKKYGWDKYPSLYESNMKTYRAILKEIINAQGTVSMRGLKRRLYRKYNNKDLVNFAVLNYLRLRDGA